MWHRRLLGHVGEGGAQLLHGEGEGRFALVGASEVVVEGVLGLGTRLLELGLSALLGRLQLLARLDRLSVRLLLLGLHAAINWVGSQKRTKTKNETKRTKSGGGGRSGASSSETRCWAAATMRSLSSAWRPASSAASFSPATMSLYLASRESLSRVLDCASSTCGVSSQADK